MIRIALHVLLALSLALNGISAPWAMAQMDHAGTEAHGAHVHDATSPAPDDADVVMHHAGHGDHALAVETGPGETDDPLDGSCCNGANCDCGCMLPPVVPLVELALTRQLLTQTRFVLPTQHAVLRRGSPPFRPPAI